MEKINLEIWSKFSNIKFDKITRKIENPRKLQKILKELSVSDKEDDIRLIAKIASKYVSKGEDSDKEGLFLFHQSNKGDVYNALYMDILYKANTPLKNKILFELGNQYLEFIDYKIKIAPRLFSAEYVFENFCEDVVKYYLTITLEKAYDVYEKNISDDKQRTWDIRWGQFLYEKGNRYTCFPMLYNSDVETWGEFLLNIEIPIFEDSGLTKREYRQDCRWYAEVLHIAYKNKHPQRELFYNKWIQMGFPKDILDKYLKKSQITLTQ